MTEESAALSCQQFELITESNIKINGLSNINESLSVHYLIYRIDNLQNSKYYIGQHKTENPLHDYMGSGLLANNAVAKHGVEKYVKNILFDFDNFEEMNEKEKDLVPLSSCYPTNQMSYNLREGGFAGQQTKLSRAKISQTRIKLGIGIGKNNGMYGRKRTEEEKRKMSETKKRLGSSKGSRNSNFKYSHEIVIDMCNEYNLNGYNGVRQRFRYFGSRDKLKALFDRHGLKYRRFNRWNTK